jgi:DNA polymerase/3'-5' exonuclease PolX
MGGGVSKRRYVWGKAQAVAEEICALLRPGCLRIEIAGSLRRRKSDVGDIEILYIPILQAAKDPEDLFAMRSVDCAEDGIRVMVATGILERRLNTLGRETYGPLNKLMLHVASGIPVDLFAATEENWFNYLVCRTGPTDLNARIATAAQSIGWMWNPYGSGFTAKDNGQVARVETEQDVFDFVGLPYQEPEARR